MTSPRHRFYCLCLLMALSAISSGPVSAAPGAEAITGNPYFKRAIQASTQMMTVLTVAIPVTGSDVTTGINQANLGFAMAGWTLVAQAAIEREGTTTQVLLTYRKSKG